MENQQTSGEEKERYPRSHLFTVRLWSEALGGGQSEWRGQVRCIASGETRYFRDWPTLAALFLEMVSGFDDRPGNKECGSREERGPGWRSRDETG
ncbi:MAG: hypothetical protein JSV36_03390 [Anaerolineae bacterium]|nr:MAG: hypothetical protein JSV36_03390 [Anaerolineae bacterium]